MHRTLAATLFIATLATPLVSFAGAQRGIPARAEQRIQDEVRHQILMLPYYNVFDIINFKVEGYKNSR